jgi:DNA-binding HxlR family transcriptional regulator/putative sterol carrier protein
MRYDPHMGTKRTYADACGIARAKDLVGERWALMIVRELLLGPKRFTDIRAGLPHLSSDMLAQRLRDLEEGGVVLRHRLPPPFAVQVYELTGRGRALEPVLIELGRWGGANCPPPTEDMCMSLDAHLVSLRTLFDAERAGDLDARVELRLGEHRFFCDIADGTIEVARAADDAAPNATITTDPTTLIEVLHGERRLAEALTAGDLRISGDKRLGRRFTTLFPLPEPAPA